MGVKAVAEDIIIRLPESSLRTDTDIANAALMALKWNVSVPEDRIRLKVENGWIWMEGEVDWQFQSNAARKCVEGLVGVRGVSNLISIKPKLNSTLIKENIRKALIRNANLDANNIMVDTINNRVILKGKVHSWFERNEAEKAAWAAPGVVGVEDELYVSS